MRPNLKLVVTGGVARPESYELVGPLAEATLSGLYLDIVLVGVDGIAARAGLTTHHEVEAHTNRALIARARRVVVVADSSKIGQVAFARICGLDPVDELITDGLSGGAGPRGDPRGRRRGHAGLGRASQVANLVRLARRRDRDSVVGEEGRLDLARLLRA